MHTGRLLRIAAIAAVATFCRDAVAQTHADTTHDVNASASLGEREIRDLVDTVAAQIDRLYIDPDTAKLIANKLRASLRAGTYRNTTNASRLAELMTADLRSVNGDLHLSERFVAASGTGSMSAPAFLQRQQHYALGRVDVLPGNIGYLELKGFAIDLSAQSLIVAALEYLKSTDAIIIDVRRNRGGSGELSTF